MSRPLRIAYPGALYHVTSRGDRREAIYLDDHDRAIFLTLLGQAAQRFHAEVFAYCLMGNHYHLVVRTTQPNISALMRHLNGSYTQAFNRRHATVGHVFQGRFHAVLVQAEPYLLVLTRYVECNPVRAKLVRHAHQWAWSSFRAHAGLSPAPTWLATDALLAAMALSPKARAGATGQSLYAAWVLEDLDPSDWQARLKGQIYLGDDAFIQAALRHADAEAKASADIPRQQRDAPQAGTPRNQGRILDMVTASAAGESLSAIARRHGVSPSTVSRTLARVAAVPGAGPTFALQDLTPS